MAEQKRWMQVLWSSFPKYKGTGEKSPPHSWLQAARVHSSQPEPSIDHCQAASLQCTCELSPTPWAASLYLHSHLHSQHPPPNLLLSHSSTFLAEGILVFSVPLIHRLGLGKAKSPLCLEACGYSPVNIPTRLFPCCPCLPYLGYCLISCLLLAATSFALTPGHYAG